MPQFDASADGGCDSCGGCGGNNCPNNQELETEVGSLHVTVGLGMLEHDRKAGRLQIHAQEPDADLFKPDTLEVIAPDDSTIEVIRDGSDILLQAKTPNLVADIEVDSSTKYRIRYFHLADMDAPVSPAVEYTPKTGMEPYRTVTIEQPPSTSVNNVRVTEETNDGSTTTVQLVNEFVWDGTDTWDLYEGLDKTTPTLAGALRRSSKQIAVAGNTRTETMKVMDAGGTVLSEVQEAYTQYPFGWVMTSSAVDPSGINLTETWTYYTTPGEDGYGKVKTYTSETGYWEHYVYDGDNALSKTIRQLDQNVYDGGDIAALEAANVVVQIHEELVEDINSTTEDVLVVRTTTSASGTQEQASYTFYRGECDVIGDTGDNLDEVWRVRSATATPESGTLKAFVEGLIGGANPDGHLISKSWAYKADYAYDNDPDANQATGDRLHDAYAEPFDTARMVSPDGQATFYDYSADRTAVVARGFMADPLAATPVVEYGTRTTSVTDSEGNAVSTKSEKVSESDNGGDWFITSFVKTAATDDFGRPTETAYYFGEDAADEASGAGGTAAYSTYTDYGTSCCGGGGEVITRTGRDGVAHKTYPDDLGRTTKSVRAATTSGQITSLMFYDGAGRVTSSGIDANGNGNLDDPADLKTVTEYDAAGRMTSTTDPEGRKSHTRYRRVKPDGSDFDPSTDTGVFYWETRSYGHNDDIPASVTWANSHGSTVLSFTAGLSWTTTPGDISNYTGVTEFSRSASVYDWDNRMTEGRAYFDIDSLAKDAPGTQGTNYLVTGKNEYDALGRGFRRTDAAGNITETVYEDGTGRSIKTLVGVDVADLHTVSRVYYNKFASGGPTGDDRPWPTRVYTVKPGLAAAPDDSDLDGSSPTFTDYTYTETVEEHSVDGTKDYMIRHKTWSRPEYGPWSVQVSEEEGRPLNSTTYRNGSTTYKLSQIYREYWGTTDASNGKRRQTQQLNISGGVSTGQYLITKTYYDDAGRQVKTETTGRGFTKTEYDAYGRTARTVFASDEGANTDADAFTDDVILTETVPTYDRSGRVIKTVTYDRLHNATATGLLSAAAANQSRVNTSLIWRDDNGRQTHQVAFGTNTPPASYDAPLTDTAPEPNTSDGYIVSKTEYDDAGRAYLSTDNLGRQSRVFFDDLGRVTHSVENWD
ncbi:MAG: hypothetical protein KTR15_05285, partial [Phycisphaeraceae bacterium]|nr:hypothetical protein [Phycisphaeraceae bacterium]